jgi:hypothetical protein
MPSRHVSYMLGSENLISEVANRVSSLFTIFSLVILSPFRDNFFLKNQFLIEYFFSKQGYQSCISVDKMKHYKLKDAALNLSSVLRPPSYMVNEIISRSHNTLLLSPFAIFLIFFNSPCLGIHPLVIPTFKSLSHPLCIGVRVSSYNF